MTADPTTLVEVTRTDLRLTDAERAELRSGIFGNLDRLLNDAHEKGVRKGMTASIKSPNSPSCSCDLMARARHHGLIVRTSANVSLLGRTGDLTPISFCPFCGLRAIGA